MMSLEQYNLEQLSNNANTFDMHIRKFNGNPTDFKSVKDKFFFIAKNLVERGELDLNDVHLVNSPYFKDAVHEGSSLYQICLLVLIKTQTNESYKVDLFNKMTDAAPKDG